MRRSSILFVAALVLAGGSASAASPGWCGKVGRSERGSLWAHEEQQARRPARALDLRAVADQDAGQIAVLEDHGDLALLANPLDLAGVGLEFRPAAAYAVFRVDRPVSAAAGSPLALKDDDSLRVELPFAFPFYGRSYSSVFVNSDGNLTFGEPDSASTARDLGRLLSGPPRVAALLADLDPSSGGSVSWRSEGDRFVVTWNGVPQFGQQDRNTFELALRKDGGVELAYAKELSVVEQGVVGLAPGGGQGGLTGVDFSTAAGSSGAGALAESFRLRDELDLVAVARRFYQAHPDDYAQLVVYTSRRLTASTTFAFETTVKNSDRGLGLEAFDNAAAFGSAGRLESVVQMDVWTKYDDEPTSIVNGEDSSLSVLAHETGHRWLVQARFRDGGGDSPELLGRQQAHWSFFVHSSGSHLEGNDIEDLGGGSFRTRASSLRYGPLDQYLMGLRPAAEVPPFFVVRDPTGRDSDPAQPPRSNATFSGTRKDVTVEDVIAALGPRQPAPGPWPAPFRQAFVYVSVGEPASAQALARVERIRAAFPAFFAASTDGRGALETRLR